MKKSTLSIIAMLIAIVVLVSFVINVVQNASDYQIEAVVIHRNGTTLWIKDRNGELWVAEDSSFHEGDKVIVTFDDNGTSSIYDDEIVRVYNAR